MKIRLLILLILALLAADGCKDTETIKLQNGSADIPDITVGKAAEASSNADERESSTVTASDQINEQQLEQKEAEIENEDRNENDIKEKAMSDRVTYQPGFYYESLSDSVKKRITGTSYPEGCTVPYEELRYVSVRHHNLNGKERTGELICNKEIAQDLVEIFYELYQAEYPIEQIRLVDEYSGDDELSMKDNNSSGFNYRVIEGTTRLSKHALGMAIDINPFYNPYVTYPDGVMHVAPDGSEPYADREAPFAFKITHDDLACKLFTAHGFTWGGDWNSVKDYQHFEK
ncbi:MAG: M15 family metallopeptidase [bacterium]|nr:M15 family metallopeptidase [bacterium]